MNKYRYLPILLSFSLWGSLSFLNAQNPLTVTASAEPLRCFGDSNGELFWEIDGGVPPYNYEWSRQSNPFVFAAGSQAGPGLFGPITGILGADVYLLDITDAAGTTVSTSLELLAPDPILITAIDVQAASCATACDGVVTMEAAGGTGALAVSWSDDPALTALNRAGLCGGEYLFQLTDESGCRQKGVVPVSAPPPLELAAAITATTCVGNADGACAVSASGGTGPYQYLWSNGVPNPDVDNLPAGSLAVSVTDANGCTLDSLLLVAEGPALLANPQVAYGCGDGRVLVSTHPVNGTAPYHYVWSTGQESAYLYGASAGVYQLTLTDAQGCVAAETVTVDFVPPLEIAVATTDVSCPAAQDGTITLTTTGGQPPFYVTWSSGAEGTTLNNLAGGAYTFNLTAAGCAEARAVYVNEPAALEVAIDYTPQADGLLTARAFAYGGTPPYDFSWSTGANADVAPNLAADQSYQLTVTDGADCAQTFTAQADLTDVERPPLETRFTIYPNPHPGVFQVAAVGVVLPAGYRVLSVTGQLVRDLRPLPAAGVIDFEELPAGIYFLQLLLEKEFYTLKTVKAR